MITLYFSPSTAAMAPHILLEELGVPFEKKLIDTALQAHRSAEFLKLNPNGLVPALVDGDLVLYEAAAICLHLCDTHPQAMLAPALGTAARAHFYKWLIWLTNTLQAALVIYFYPHRWVDDGNVAGAAEVQAHAEQRIHDLLDQLDDALAQQQALHSAPWLLGVDYSAVDLYAFTLCRWTRKFAAWPARDRPHLGPYLQRVLARPAVQRVMAAEGLAPPFV